MRIWPNCRRSKEKGKMEVEDVFADLLRLETEHLLLRKVSFDDVKDVFEYASDPQVSRYVGWEAHQTIRG